jgi:predicted PhzF superfamily epimerase YddE/YHI9
VEQQAAQLPLSFHTRSGELKVARDAKTSSLLELDFPAGAPAAPPAAAVAPLAAALAAALSPSNAATLQADIAWLGRAEALGDLVVLLSSEAAVRALSPDFALLAQLGGRGVVVTAPAPSPAADYGTTRTRAPCGPAASSLTRAGMLLRRLRLQVLLPRTCALSEPCRQHCCGHSKRRMWLQ